MQDVEWKVILESTIDYMFEKVNKMAGLSRGMKGLLLIGWVFKELAHV